MEYRKGRAGSWQTLHHGSPRSPRGGPGGLRLFLSWLLLGMLTVVGLTLGLAFMLVGWLLLPLVRRWVRRRLRRFQQESGGAAANDPFAAMAEQRRRATTIEGDYTVESQE